MTTVPSSLESARDLVDRCARRGARLEATQAEKLLQLARDVDPALVATHFDRVRHLDRYLRNFRVEQISQHLELLALVDPQQLVVTMSRPHVEPNTFDIVVIGVDLVGVSACVTGCLAELGLSILQLEIFTYLPIDDQAPAKPAPGLIVIDDKYVLVVRAVAHDENLDALLLTETLAVRLKAAYWHLVRGDLRGARHESDDQDDLVGQVLDGRFRLDRRLAQGGLGTVYLAKQLDLDRLVAVKLLRAEYTDNPRFAESFQREARLLAQIQSPKLVHVYAVGVAQGRCWMALEYMTGGDVAHWVTSHGPAPLDLAARWLGDCLAGLEFIHDHLGLVHCDIKPHNLLLDARANLKLGDLGLSELSGLKRVVAPDGRIKGTPMYMSPEQARGDALDQRSDLYSLGSSFFYILTGSVPYDAANGTELLAKVARGDAKQLSQVAPDVEGPAAVLVRRLMHGNPRERYQRASVALADLESYFERGIASLKTTSVDQLALGRSVSPGRRNAAASALTPGAIRVRQQADTDAHRS